MMMTMSLIKEQVAQTRVDVGENQKRANGQKAARGQNSADLARRQNHKSRFASSFALPAVLYRRSKLNQL